MTDENATIKLPVGDLDVCKMAEDMKDMGISYMDAVICSRIVNNHILRSVSLHYPTAYKRVASMVDRILMSISQNSIK